MNIRGVVWFKKDLRVHDQTALYYAAQQCQQGVIGLYIIDRSMWKKHHTSLIQIEFILKHLESLRIDLESLGIPLWIHEIDHTKNIPEFILKLTSQHQINALYYNREYELDETKRDQAVTDLLEKNNIACYAHDDQLILSPALLHRKPTNHFFKIFTHFKRHWINIFSQNKIALLPQPKIKQAIQLKSSTIAIKNSDIDLSLWPAGEKSARLQLKRFTQKKIFNYDKERDFPALDNTSRLSPYLAIGVVSARTCFLAALQANNHELDTGNVGALTWMSELIWREFYRHIMIANPSICMHKPFKRITDQLPWRYDEKLLIAWQHGKTGFPLVDAAMRQLNQTGWMHNRLRMVTAMFLSKNLFLDWRLGEQYFCEQLIDLDFASNNGGWQWCASTGTDAVPYFRIFNPTTQSQRFDPEGHFIRQYCPELSHYSAKEIHQPANYLPPIIDYKKSREVVLKAFKSLTSPL